MSVRIIIRQKDIRGEKLLDGIKNLSSHVVIVNDTIVTTPAVGRIVDLLHFLRDHGIAYQTAQPNSQETCL